MTEAQLRQWTCAAALAAVGLGISRQYCLSSPPAARHWSSFPCSLLLYGCRHSGWKDFRRLARSSLSLPLSAGRVALSARARERIWIGNRTLREDAASATLVRRAARVLEQIASASSRGAAARPRHRFDPRRVPSAPATGADRRGRLRVTANPHNQTFAVGIQLGLVGHRGAVGDVDRASAAVPRRRACRLDRARGRDAEHRRLAVQLASVRFHRRAGSTCSASASPAAWCCKARGCADAPAPSP